MRDEIETHIEYNEELLKECIGWKISKETTDKILDHRGVLRYNENQTCRFCQDPESILTKHTCCNGFSNLEILKFEKDKAYWERNQLVAYLSKMHESWVEKHPIEDEKWENDYRNIVFIKFPEGLFSWHFKDSDRIYFSHLKLMNGNSWDGSTRQEKYERLRDKK